ncbi:winged helix-turn-helix domain-containing protein [Caulobacter sp. LjRoot300]|uniref:winged helix-turn-helix domain-containing protein n=1 Tax=Caulobacter sp. LjRoot300 TaxID=3342321 RepID=UPI003F4FB622
MTTNPPNANLLTAAEEVLRRTNRPMTCRELATESLKLGLIRKHGTTPEKTLSTSLNRSITNRGISSPFIKVHRGLYGINPLHK